MVKVMFTLHQIALRDKRRYGVNSSGLGLEEVIHTHRTSYRNGWPREFGALKSSPVS